VQVPLNNQWGRGRWACRDRVTTVQRVGTATPELGVIDHQLLPSPHEMARDVPFPLPLAVTAARVRRAIMRDTVRRSSQNTIVAMTHDRPNRRTYETQQGSMWHGRYRGPPRRSGAVE
jgi:hypothetical protein